MGYVKACSVSLCRHRRLVVGEVEEGVRTEGAERLEARINADAVILRQGEDGRGYSCRTRHLSPEAEIRGTYTANPC